MRGLVWLYQSCGNKGSVRRVSVLRCDGVGGVGREWVGIDQGLEGWVGVSCESGIFV